MQWYLDASVMAKRYAAETGTPAVNHLFNQMPRPDMLCLALGMLEVISIFVRKRNVGHLSAAAFAQAMTDLRFEILENSDLGKITMSEELIEAAIPLIPLYSLNATDSVILRSALDIEKYLRSQGDRLVLATSDQRLRNAATSEGLTTFDPDTQSQLELDALLASP